MVKRLFLFLVLVSSTYATTTNITTVKPNGGGDYLSLSAWETGRRAAHVGSSYNLVTDDCVEIANCYSGTDTNQVTFGNWHADATHFLQIQTPLSDRHSGVWDSSKYNLMVADTSQVLYPTVDYTKVIGLQIGISAQTKNIEICYFAASNQVMSYCIIKGLTNSSFLTRGVSVINGMSIFNCLIYDMGNNANSICIQNHKNTTIESCTFIQSGGIEVVNFNDGGYTCDIKNTYAGGSTFHTILGGSSTVNITTCATSDNDGTVGLRAKGISTTNFVNVTAGSSSQDYHLIKSSPLVGAGTDTSGEVYPFNFTDDISGQPRIIPWYIGAELLSPKSSFIANGQSVFITPNGTTVLQP